MKAPSKSPLYHTEDPEFDYGAGISWSKQPWLWKNQSFQQKKKQNPVDKLLRKEQKTRAPRSAEAYLKLHSRAYLEYLNGLLDTTYADNHVTEMKDGIKTVICIPVAAEQENYLYTSLENYSFQNLPTAEWEILLFSNLKQYPQDLMTPDEVDIFNPDWDNDCFGDILDKAHLQYAYPDINIQHIMGYLPPDKLRMGAIRKILADITLVRYLRRGINDPNFSIIMADADNHGMSNQLLQNYVETFTKHPEIQAIGGKIDFDIESNIRNPLLHVGTRMFQYIDLEHLQGQKSKLGLSGANCAYRLEAYWKVGGYDEKATRLEDSILSDRIRTYCNDSPTLVPIRHMGGKSKLFTSNRHGADTLENQLLAPVMQFIDDKAISYDSKFIRSYPHNTNHCQYDFSSKKDRLRFKNELESIINETLCFYDLLQGDAQSRKIIQRVLSRLHIDYIEDFRINHTGRKVPFIYILDYTRLIRKLIEYPRKALNMYEKKTGQTWKNNVSEELVRNVREQTRGVLGSLSKNYKEVVISGLQKAIFNGLQRKQLEENGYAFAPLFTPVEKADVENQPCTRIDLDWREEIFTKGNIIDAIKESHDPDTKFDSYNTVQEYFKQHTKEYQQMIVELASQIEPMEESIQASICIPVAGFQEPDLDNSLYHYTAQTAKASTFEIVAFLNHPTHNKDGQSTGLDHESILAFEKFQKDHPEINFRYIYATFPREHLSIGWIRKLLHDTVLYRHHQRGKQASDLILINNDADNHGVDRHYITTFLKKFQEHPNTDAFEGYLDYDVESFIRNPWLLLSTKIWLLFCLYEAIHGRCGFPGANGAMRASSYAGMGGFDARCTVGEDADIRRRILEFRDDSKKFFGLGRGGIGTRIYSSSRRAEETLKKGFAANNQWAVVKFQIEDVEVRSVNRRDDYTLVDWSNTHTADLLKRKFTDLFIQTAKNYTDSRDSFEKISQQFDFVLRRGFQVGYTLTKGDHLILDIHDVDQLQQKLITYEDRSRRILRAKTGINDQEIVKGPRSVVEIIHMQISELISVGKDDEARRMKIDLEREITTYLEHLGKLQSYKNNSSPRIDASVRKIIQQFSKLLQMIDSVEQRLLFLNGTHIKSIKLTI